MIPIVLYYNRFHLHVTLCNTT